MEVNQSCEGTRDEPLFFLNPELGRVEQWNPGPGQEGSLGTSLVHRPNI